MTNARGPAPTPKVARPRTTKGVALALFAGAALAPAALAQTPVYLQWWENRWTDMEHRTPDFFVAGYGALWLPPVHKAASAASVGYDPFDRFDLGRPGATTAYGTEQEFRAVLAELQQANALVNIDIVMNHNSGRTTDRGFWLAGGYPGFWGGGVPATGNKLASDSWGDFHNGSGCCTFLQSENPSGANYNLLNGDLVALIDIAQEVDNRFVRHPINSNPITEIFNGNPVARPPIPPGTVWNLPSASNARLYPDRDLAGFTFTVPAQNITAATPPRVYGSTSVTVYPFNNTTPLAGDPVPENATAMLARWTQWMLDVYKVDGFRIDAIKHSPNWFFDRFWDPAVFQRRTTPSGAKVTPFSFGESVESNSFTYNNFIRKDGFGNRDALDLNGAGQLRNLLNAAGVGSWQNVISSHLDNADDGVNNGSIGVNHTFSHDNGSTGNGSSQPPIPTYKQQGWVELAYTLLRTGVPNVYHNARGINRPGGFWPREGNPSALGVDPFTGQLDSTITRLVQLHNWYGRGDFRPLTPASEADALVFERFRNNSGVFSANVLVGVNDRYDGGFDQRTVTTSFPAGTILREMTGNADDAVVDPFNDIPSTITVGAGGSVTIRVPRNLNASNVEHNKGFVVYGPVVPTGVLSVSPVASTIDPDPVGTALPLRRTTAVDVITNSSFSLGLLTTQADPNDPGTDTEAVFRIDQGFRDLNGNGIVDKPASDLYVPGYEGFRTTNLPLFSAPSGTTNGRYFQTIPTGLLSEGYHYISVVAFRSRPANTDPLWREFRKVIYVDLQPPAVSIRPTPTLTTTSTEVVVDALDRTTSAVYIFANLPAGVDPATLANPQTLARRQDRFEWRWTIENLVNGANTITVLALEDSGNKTILQSTVNVALPCYPNCDNSTIAPVLNAGDFTCFLQRFRDAQSLPPIEQQSNYANCDGSGVAPVLNAGDFVCFLNQFRSGCP